MDIPTYNGPQPLRLFEIQFRDCDCGHHEAISLAVIAVDERAAIDAAQAFLQKNIDEASLPNKAAARRTLRAFIKDRLALDIEEVANGVVVNWNDFECCGS